MWKTLVHNGPYIQPLFTKVDGVELIYDGIEIYTPKEVQQYLFLYAKNAGRGETVFDRNFFGDLWNLFPKSLRNKGIGLNPELYDISAFDQYWANYVKTPKDKEETLKIKEFHSYCLLDGVSQIVAGYATEPAALFKGLGDNPNRGKIKLAVKPEDVTINTSIKPKDFPKPPYGKWGAIVHDDTKIYTAAFKSNVTNKVKYVYLNRNSEFKTNSELEKYEKARSLALIIDNVRDAYTKLLKSENQKEKETGLAVYLVDRYAFRVGNEPGTGSGADTTGATTLTKKNITFKGGNKVHFDFVAKDSIRYESTKKMDKEAFVVISALWKAAKNKNTPLFTISSSRINTWLEGQMPGLTAKVFRTYNASTLVAELLAKDLGNLSPAAKLAEFIKVNVEIAIICNHKTAVSPEKREKLDAAIKALEETGETSSKLEKLLRDKATLGVALNTSKLNYIDPRLVYSWCFKNEIQPKEIYSKTVLEATSWAAESEGFEY